MAVKKIASVKVARVISPREVAFNAGSNQEIEEGDTVVISRRVEITDPDTSESLGAVLVPKIRFNVSLVSEKYCLGKVADRVGGSWGTITPLKTVTEDRFQEDDEVVYVALGDVAEVRRTVTESPDEAPF